MESGNGSEAALEGLSKRSLCRRVLLAECLAMSFAATFFWADEGMDLPHRFFGVPPTPANWIEAGMETAVLACLGGALLFMTHRTLRRLHLLEGMLPICSNCKRIRMPGVSPADQAGWVPVETFWQHREPVRFTHSLCPRCVIEMCGEETGNRILRRMRETDETRP